MKYYNRNNSCETCGIKFELAPGHPYREYNINKNWTGRWICKRCRDNPYRDTIKDPEHIQKYMLDKYYNRTSCDICGKDIKIRGLREYDHYGNWTGRWLCEVCHGRCSYHSHNNIMKRTRDFRINNLDPNSAVAKGLISEIVTCNAYQIESLNLKNDNLECEIDHTFHHIYGIFQTKGMGYDDTRMSWHTAWKNEHHKKFDLIILYCYDKWIIERVYIIPYEEVIIRHGIEIVRDPCRDTWYEKYRKDEKQYDNIYQRLTIKDLHWLRKNKYGNIEIGKKIINGHMV